MFDLYERIHFMHNGKPTSAPVLAIKVVENSTTANKSLHDCCPFAPFGPAGIWYATYHGVVGENDAFRTPKEVLLSVGEDDEQNV